MKTFKKFKAALVLDNMSLSVWQEQALDEASDLLDVRVILNCKNTSFKRKYVKHFLYYILNFFVLKNPLTRKKKYKLKNERVYDFFSLYRGSWQCFPEDIPHVLESEKIDVIIKFGMSLLVIDKTTRNIPVLSYHHGDPSKYRGRPAGFYELYKNESTNGVIVQKLSNELDAGAILAFSESKLFHYSYRKSAIQFYKISKYLLRKALINMKQDCYLDIQTNGCNYRLPSNFMVSKFIAILSLRFFKYIFYGAFYEKKWRVALLSENISLNGIINLDQESFNEFDVSSKYSFYADPFFSTDGKRIRLEALNKKTGLGDIVEIKLDDKNNPISLFTGDHYSYPLSFLVDGDEFILPEVASHSSQFIVNAKNTSVSKNFLLGLEGKRLSDATILEYNGLWYLFFGESDSSHAVLNLWVAESIDGVFHRHINSPISITPSSSRMAGRFLYNKDGLYRFGQNNERSYGASITVMKVTDLSQTSYNEKKCAEISIKNLKGPHTIDFNAHSEEIVVDYYKDTFSLFAGLRRFKAIFFSRFLNTLIK